MATVHHLDCGHIQAPGHGLAICHCLLVETDDGLVLLDTGLGIEDVRDPLRRIGQPLIDLVGFQFAERLTALRQIEALGFRGSDVRRIVLTHCDPDHVGGLSDFPHAEVHVSAEEHAALMQGHFRYLPVQFAHGPSWTTHSASPLRWFGLEARPVPLGSGLEVLLIPLFGHTTGHCGVAVRREAGWLLHVGDAYYLRVELESDDHPVSLLAAQRAVDDAARRASLEELRRLARDHANEIAMFGYHDPGEFPEPP